MISKISNHFVSLLEKNKTISTDESEIYSYGFFILISHVVYFVICLILGIIFKCAIESVAFLTSFQFIRKYAGGYHAKTETRCEILSAASIAVCIMFIKLANLYDLRIVLLLFSLVSVVVILVLSPLESPVKPLSKQEHMRYRTISWIILLIISALIIVSYIFEWKYFFAPCCISLILEGMLLISGKVKYHFDKAYST
ncbi:MAG: accessory gene regulator B family protein [Eubacterium sp.]|nr:accessory gene regulator B family protein [Eubacterium sp.]